MIRKAIIVVLTMGAVATVFLWVDSYRIRRYPTTPEGRRWLAGSYQLPEVLEIPGLNTRHYFSSNRKILMLWVPRGRLSLAYNSLIEGPVLVPRTNVQAGRFWYESNRAYWPRPDGTYAYYREHEISMPLWFVFAAFATYPAIAFVRGPFWRYRRRRKGLCLNCAYDLTGNVSGVCPECGAEVDGHGPGRVSG